MAASEADGNATALTAGGGETTLSTLTSAGTYQFSADLSVLSGSDILEIRIYTKIRSGGTSRVAWMGVYGPRSTDDQNIYSPPLMCPNEFKVTATLTGTNRTLTWAIVKP